MNDVFLLGAGFSKAISDRMPVLRELTGIMRERVPVPAEKEPAAAFTGDFESWLTYLSTSHPWLTEANNLRNRALFLELSSRLQEVLFARMHFVNVCARVLSQAFNEGPGVRLAQLTRNGSLTRTEAYCCAGFRSSLYRVFAPRASAAAMMAPSR